MLAKEEAVSVEAAERTSVKFSQSIVFSGESAGLTGGAGGQYFEGAFFNLPLDSVEPLR